MYLVGILGDLREEQTYLIAKFKYEITKDDLIKCRTDEFYQIVDVLNKKYYCPDENKWVEIPVE